LGFSAVVGMPSGPRSPPKRCKLLARTQVLSIVGIPAKAGLVARKACADSEGRAELVPASARECRDSSVPGIELVTPPVLASGPRASRLGSLPSKQARAAPKCRTQHSVALLRPRAWVALKARGATALLILPET
jgi:hypothetical protein